MEILIAILNTQAVQVGIVSLIGLLAAKLFVKVPKAGLFFEKYKGAMIHAVKMAETEIPDGTDNKALKRLDIALQYTIKLIEVAEAKSLNYTDKMKIKSDLSLVHHEVKDAK